METDVHMLMVRRIYSVLLVMARVILRRTVQKEPSTVPNTKYYVQIHGLYLFKSFYISEGLQIQNKYYNG